MFYILILIIIICLLAAAFFLIGSWQIVLGIVFINIATGLLDAKPYIRRR